MSTTATPASFLLARFLTVASLSWSLYLPSLASSPGLETNSCRQALSSLQIRKHASPQQPLVLSAATEAFPWSIRLLDFRFHDPNSEAIQSLHDSIRIEVLSRYHEHGILTNRILNTFLKGLDEKRSPAISWYYMSGLENGHSERIVATAKLVRFSKADFYPQSPNEQSVLQSLLPIWPRFDLERKSKFVLPEHQFLVQSDWSQRYTSMIKEWNSKSLAPEEKTKLFRKLRQEWVKIPGEAFRVAELTGVSSHGSKNLGFDAIDELLSSIWLDAQALGLKRIYLLATNPKIRNYWQSKGFTPLRSYIDPEKSIEKTIMFIEIPKHHR